MAKPIKSSPAAQAPVRSEVRNSPIPRNTASPSASTPTAGKKQITHEMIARRAYEISQSPQCGSEFDNWLRAERELRNAIR